MYSGLQSGDALNLVSMQTIRDAHCWHGSGNLLGYCSRRNLKQEAPVAHEH